MDMEEFHDFVIDVGLETILKTNPAAAPAVYNFEMMKEQFSKADKSGKGMAGPAANSELVLYEFLNMLVRIAFWRANPSFGLWKDKDGDGWISFDEMLEEMGGESKEEIIEAQELFEKHDKDGDGYLTLKELEGLIRESGDETWAEKEANWWSKEDN